MIRRKLRRLDKRGKVRSFIKKNRALNWVYYDILAKIISKNTSNRISVYGSGLLKHVHNLLGSENLMFFVDFGTLLGIIREGKFISYDLDIDLGIVVEDVPIPVEIEVAVPGPVMA